jgi:ABC-type multidrug transport system permease subunit
MNYNRSDRLLRSNRPITWLYNLQQQVFKALKLAVGIKTQFYKFFLIFLLFFLYTVEYLRLEFVNIFRKNLLFRQKC